jgi:PBP1b-binding outer membrane lipoprotein LpoB
MKKFLVLLAFAAIIFAGCSKDDEIALPSNPVTQPLPPPDPPPIP